MTTAEAVLDALLLSTLDTLAVELNPGNMVPRCSGVAEVYRPRVLSLLKVGSFLTVDYLG